MANIIACCVLPVCLQGQLLQGMVGPLDSVMEYQDIKTTAGKLLQYVRSMPAVTSAIVGQKVRAVCDIAGRACPEPPLSLEHAY